MRADVSQATEHSIDVTIKNTGYVTKRKCLFPSVNENKTVFNDDKLKMKILIELDSYLSEESYDPNSLFRKKHVIRVCINLA